MRDHDFFSQRRYSRGFGSRFATPALPSDLSCQRCSQSATRTPTLIWTCFVRWPNNALITPWQPAAADPDDEAFVQLARESQVEYLVTHNVNDVAGARQFGVQVVRPAEFLSKVRKAT